MTQKAFDLFFISFMTLLDKFWQLNLSFRAFLDFGFVLVFDLYYRAWILAFLIFSEHFLKFSNSFSFLILLNYFYPNWR